VILLDTHAAFWLNQAPERLSPAAHRAIRRAAASTGLALASISLWELARLVEGRRLRVRGATTEAFVQAIVQTPNLVVLEISPEIAAIAAQSAPGFPKDPADSLIAATALVYDIPLVTKDRAMQESSRIRTIW
jgi:PIN domain nuclease of toxin-antitoxin system